MLLVFFRILLYILTSGMNSILTFKTCFNSDAIQKCRPTPK